MAIKTAIHGDILSVIAKKSEVVANPKTPRGAATIRCRMATVFQVSERKGWGGRRDSNPQHPEPQSGALPLSYGHQPEEEY
jgi:hypothetical protein